MSSLTQPNDAVATVTVSVVDQIGRPIALPAGLAAVSSDPAVATVAVGADGASIDITPVADGSTTINLTDGALTTSLSVDVVAPTATTLIVNVSGVTFAPLPAAAPAETAAPAVGS